MLERLRAKLGRHRPAEDVERNPTLATTRSTGGADTDAGDSASTTGGGRSGEFVGRVTGEDLGGDEGYSGAEARADAGERN